MRGDVNEPSERTLFGEMAVEINLSRAFVMSEYCLERSNDECEEQHKRTDEQRRYEQDSEKDGELSGELHWPA